MKIRFPMWAALELPLVILFPLNLWQAWGCWQEGDPKLSALAVTAALMNVWMIRRVPDRLITTFCVWWMKRKAIRAVKFLMSLEEEKKEKNQ